MRSRNTHNFSLGFMRKYDPDKLVSLRLFYRSNMFQTSYTLDIKVKYGDWDKKKQHLKKSIKGLESYKSDVKYIDDIGNRINKVLPDMNKGILTLDSAIRTIMNRNPEGIVKMWLEDSKCYSKNTRDKYIDFIEGIEKNTPYKPLKFEHIQDLRTIRDIALLLKESVNNNSVREYMQAMDSVTANVPLNNINPFKKNKLRPPSNTSDKLPRTSLDIFKAMRKIPVQVVNKDSKEWYLALNMWLYSFSLRGLTGKDIPNISEKYVKGEKYEMPYYPDYMTNKEYSSLGGKSYLVMRRGKTTDNKSMTILLNSFPSFLLHQSLKQLIKECLPQYAYQGKDKLRLFNFVTKDEKYQPDLEGEKKWKDVKDWFFRRLNRMMGVGLHNTRHTYTSLGNSFLNLTDSEQREQIGQKSKGALKHYQTPHQIRADINHMSILDDFNFVHIVRIFFAQGYRKDYLSLRLTQGAINLVKEDKLQSFNVEDMFKLEQLKNQWHNRPQTTFNEEGDLILDKSEKPQELIELEKQMNKFSSDPDYDWRQEATSQLFSLVSKRDKFYIEEGYATEMSIKLMQEYEDKQNKFSLKK